MENNAKTPQNAVFYFTDEENDSQLGEIIVPLDSQNFTELNASGYKFSYLHADSELPLMVVKELFNRVQRGDFEILDSYHTDPILRYTKWVKTLGDGDLEEEWNNRYRDYFSDGQNEEYVGQYEGQYRAVDAVREERLKGGRYLEDVY